MTIRVYVKQIPLGALNMVSHVRSALVICTRRIGDVLLATPLVEALTVAYPGVKIDMLVFAGTESVIAPWQTLHRIWTIPQRPSKGEHWRLIRSLWRRYDLAISVLPGDRPTWYAWIAGRHRTGTLATDKKSRWKRFLLHAWVPFDNLDTHTVVMNLRQLSQLPNPIPSPAVTWSVEDASRVQRNCAVTKTNSAYAVLHVTPKFVYKAWTAEGWASVARWLQEQGLIVLITAGPALEERASAARVTALTSGAAEFLPEMRLPEMAYLLSRSRLYVGTDTGVSHMAAALGIPSVVLFGPSNPVKWGPWPKDHVLQGNSPWQTLGSQQQGNVYLLQGIAACVPCFEEGCDRHVGSTSRCLQELPAERVINAIEAMLAHAGPYTKR